MLFFHCFFVAFFAQQKRPNIIVILSDDVGFEEFGVYDVKKGVASLTPNIDKLGASGTVFKNAWGKPYVALQELCSIQEIMPCILELTIIS